MTTNSPKSPNRPRLVHSGGNSGAGNLLNSRQKRSSLENDNDDDNDERDDMLSSLRSSKRDSNASSSGSGRSLNRARGQLKLSIGALSSRAINSQHKSVRNFLRGGAAAAGNQNLEKESPLVSPASSPRKPIARTTPTLTSPMASLTGKVPLASSSPSSPTKTAAAATASNRPSISKMTSLRQELTRKCEISRRHPKMPDHEISFKWGSLKFSIYEGDEFGVPKRVSELASMSELSTQLEEMENEEISSEFLSAPQLADYTASSTMTDQELQDRWNASANLDNNNDTAYDDNYAADHPNDERPMAEERLAAANSGAVPSAETGTVMIEVAPGVEMPLKTPLETWHAVEDGCITVTTCNHCKVELTCTDDAQLVMCADCWVFSPVDQAHSSQRSIEEMASAQDAGCVSVGIRTEEIFEWLAIQEAAALMG